MSHLLVVTMNRMLGDKYKLSLKQLRLQNEDVHSNRIHGTGIFTYMDS